MLDHVKAIARNGFASRIKIFEDYDPSLPPVYANRDQLVQVFLNLVKNAAEAIGTDPRRRDHAVDRVPARHSRRRRRAARTASRCRSNSACATMAPGVSEDILPILFDPFITTKPNGSGLGLALVAKIVGEHGGIIECDSSPRGTSFRILMPAWKQMRRRPRRRDRGDSK